MGTVDPYSTAPLDEQYYRVALNSTGVESKTGTSARAGAGDDSATDTHHEEEPPPISRKSILSVHRIAGLTTLALWFATNLAGEEALEHLEPDMKKSSVLAYALDPTNNFPLYAAMQYDNPAFLLLNQNGIQSTANQYMMYKYFRDNAEYTSSAGDTHIALGMATMAAYTVTAGLALAAPDDDMEGDFYDDGSIDSVFLHRNLAWIHLAALAAMPILGHSLEEKGPDRGRTKQNVAWAGFLTLSIAAVTVSF